MGVKGKKVLVIGGRSGIGEATARAYAEGGARVVISGRDQQRGEQIVRELSNSEVRARFVRADLAHLEDVQRLTKEAGHVDVLVNNAGVFPFGPTHEADGQLFDSTSAAKVRAPFFLVGALAPRPVADGGARSSTSPRWSPTSASPGWRCTDPPRRR